MTYKRSFSAEFNETQDVFISMYLYQITVLGTTILSNNFFEYFYKKLIKTAHEFKLKLLGMYGHAFNRCMKLLLHIDKTNLFPLLKRSVF